MDAGVHDSLLAHKFLPEKDYYVKSDLEGSGAALKCIEEGKVGEIGG